MNEDPISFPRDMIQNYAKWPVSPQMRLTVSEEFLIKNSDDFQDAISSFLVNFFMKIRWLVFT